MADASEHAYRIRYLIDEIIDSKILEHAEGHTINLSSNRLGKDLENALAEMFRDAQAGPQPAPPPEPEPAPEPEHIKWGKLKADYPGVSGSGSTRVSKCKRYSIRVEMDGFDAVGEKSFRHYYLYRGVFPTDDPYLESFRSDRQAREAADRDAAEQTRSTAKEEARHV